MNEQFNLVDQEWIPCTTPSGALAFFGISETLVRAQEFAEICDESPLVTVAIHRLLLAVLHRIFGPESPEVWADIWKQGAGRFDRVQIESYLKSPRIYPRFDLFDDKYPFYQTRSLPFGEMQRTSGRPKFVKPIWQMAHELAYSDSMNLFAHFTEDTWEIRPADQAARWLVAFQAFALGGLITTEEGRKAQDGSADAGPLVKSAVALAKGDNLFQTLMLNLIHYSAEDEEPFSFRKDADVPAWEREEETRAIDRKFDGYLDLLTWQCRRVKLIPERDHAGKLLGVSGVVTMKGFQLPDNSRFGKETMVGFVRKEKAKANEDPWPPLGFRSEKSLWRNCHVLFQSQAEKSERPKTLKWIDDLRLKNGQIHLELYGMCSDRAKVFFWRHESWPLPLLYLDNALLVESLKQSLDLAECVASQSLRAAVWAAVADRLTANADQSPDSKRVGSVIDSLGADRYYWSRLELPFREFLVSLAADVEQRETRVRKWFGILREAAIGAFDETVGRLDGGRDLKAVNAGRSVLLARLRQIHDNAFGPDIKGGAA